MTLTAVDNSGWGIALTEFKLDTADWAPYTAPFPVSGEGVHSVLYRPTTRATSSREDLTVKIDTAAVVTYCRAWYAGSCTV